MRLVHCLEAAACGVCSGASRKAAMRRPRLSLWAFVWPAAALGIFAGLQIWRIGILDCLRRTRPPPPSLYTELSAWSAYAQVAEPDVYAAFRPLQAVWEVRKDHPDVLVDMTAWGIALAVAGWPVALAFLTAASFAHRRLPRSMTLRYRLRTAFAALAMGTPWGIPFGVVVGAVVWFIGFDRNGTGRPMIDALAPTPVQACAILLAWSAFIAIAGVFLLYRAATLDGPACLRCGYPRAGLSAERCPECGRPFDEAEPAPPTARACHATVARWTLILAFAVAAIGTITAVVHPAARDWIRLRAGRAERRTLEVGLVTFSPDTLQTRRFKCIYGTITLRADEEPGGGGSGALWTIAWMFTPNAHSPLPAASGTITVSSRPKPPADFSRTYRRFPFGELCFYQVSTPHVLSVAGSRLIFTPEKWPPAPRAPDGSTTTERPTSPP